MNDAKGSGKLSRSSSSALDPLSNVLEVLGARVTRLTRMEAAGDWALSFPSIDRLKFVALLRGSAWMLLPGCAPQLMQAGDVCLIGPTGYAVASDPALTPADGARLYERPGCDVARIGGEETVGVGGTVTFAGPNADFLLDMLPDFMIVPRSLSGSGAISTILSLMSGEIERDTIGSGIVSARLADVLLVEMFRAYVGQARPAERGWLGALLDPRIGRALRALHADVAHPWTVADLAHVAGMSRAAFAAEFTRRIGQPPLSYLRAWRLALARKALSGGETSVADVAEMVGYRSQGAFAQAFRRAFGSSPRNDRASKAEGAIPSRDLTGHGIARLRASQRLGRLIRRPARHRGPRQRRSRPLPAIAKGAMTLQCSFCIIAVRAWCSICDWRMTAERTFTRWPLSFQDKPSLLEALMMVPPPDGI